MKYLLDTCVISEMIKPMPNPAVIDWINHHRDPLLFLSVLTIGEIQAVAEQRGVKMPIIESLIAATGLVHDLTVVTRNVADMTNSGVKLLNVWDEHV